MDFVNIILAQIKQLQIAENSAKLLKVSNDFLIQNDLSRPFYLLFLDSRQKLISYNYDKVEWKKLVLIISVSIFLVELFLELRQFLKLTTKKVPKLLDGIVDQTSFDKSGAYQRDKWKIRVFNSFYSTGQLVLAIHYDFLPKLWHYSSICLKEYLLILKPSELHQSIVFVGLLILINALLGYPTSLYSTFVVEARHGIDPFKVRNE